MQTHASKTLIDKTRGLKFTERPRCCLGFIAPLKSGTAIGFGTIPDCTGCDHDDFIDPGADIEIRFERLGSLRCRFARPSVKLLASRWPVRPALEKYHASDCKQTVAGGSPA